MKAESVTDRKKEKNILINVICFWNLKIKNINTNHTKLIILL